MKLSDYDGKCVRIVDFEGDVFEGICSYNNEAYMEHEYGVHEECLQLANFIFYRSHIKDIESLEGNCGPYGRFTSCYRRLEELNIEDGINSIREVLFSEENEHIFRLLLCIDRHLDTYY